MTELAIREGKFDLVIAAAPGLEVWPSAGVRALTSLCADMGLNVGLFGGDDLRVRGVVPLPGTGGVVMVEDAQHRIHRIQARSVVKVSSAIALPDPFPGWRSQGSVPLSTAQRLKREEILHWDPCTVILGTGNRAFRFGTELLQSGTPEVYCIETYAQWGAKRFSGWEVEKRRFEMAGGKLLEAKPVRLSQKSAMLWELRVQDSQGVRLLDVARVVSAGPFRENSGLREHPRGSMLFEIEQTAGNTQAEDVEGWKLEEERARWLAVKIVRSLSTDLPNEKRDELDRVFKRARGRLKRHGDHFAEPFTPSYQGKWMASGDARKIRAFSGVPRSEHHQKPIASVECVEQIGCDLCQRACPTQAIDIFPRPAGTSVLKESQCTGCGLCLSACPSEAISMVQEPQDRSVSKLTLIWRGKQPWKENEFAVLTNRRGDALGSARVVTILPSPGSTQLVQLDVPTHLVWEARSLRRPKSDAVEDEAFFASLNRSASSESKVEVTVQGEKRLVPDQISLTSALFEMGCNRPEDALFCRDGSCGLCEITVDGSKKLACQTQIHRGMALKIDSRDGEKEGESLCPCLGITREQIVERMQNGRLRSPEAVLSVTHVGEGKCRGQLCMGPFRRVLTEQGVETEGWIDWRFPWSEWVLGHS